MSLSIIIKFIPIVSATTMIGGSNTHRTMEIN